MPLFLGTTEFGSNVEKIYRGTNIVYETISEIEFTSCLFPTTWTTVTTGTKYSASNDYGEWTIQASSYNGTASNGLYNAFDGSTSTGSYIPYGTSSAWFSITSPVAIKPTEIYLSLQSCNGGTVQGLNSETGEWETLGNFTDGTQTITTENYYIQFKVNVNAPSSAVMVRNIKEFQITKGIYKYDYNIQIFSTCPYPTSWTKVSDNSYGPYTSTNDYGEWSISCDSLQTTSSIVTNAFDAEDGTSWISAYHNYNDVPATISISCPVLIKPTKITIKHSGVSNGFYSGKIQGYNPSTETWTDLATLAQYNAAKIETFSISGDTFYSAFRVLCYRYSSSYVYSYIYYFDITEGIIKPN